MCYPKNKTIGKVNREPFPGPMIRNCVSGVGNDAEKQGFLCQDDQYDSVGRALAG